MKAARCRAGRCCDICDPGTIGLPDPATLPIRPADGRGSSPRAGTIVATPARADQPLLDALRAWRSHAGDGKPAYTVAHNRTLAQIAAARPRTEAELAAIPGVGRAFIERHGAAVLALVRRADGEASGLRPVQP